MNVYDRRMCLESHIYYNKDKMLVGAISELSCNRERE